MRQGIFWNELTITPIAPSETKCKIAKVGANIKRRATKTKYPAQVILEQREIGGTPEAAPSTQELCIKQEEICGCKGKLISNYQIKLIEKITLKSPSNVNDLAPMNSFLYSTVDKVMLIEFSSLETSLQLLSQSQNWFGMELLRFAPRYSFRSTLFMYTLTNVFSTAFTLFSKTKSKKLILDYLEKLNNTWQTLLPIF